MLVYNSDLSFISTDINLSNTGCLSYYGDGERIININSGDNSVCQSDY